MIIYIWTFGIMFYILQTIRTIIIDNPEDRLTALLIMILFFPVFAKALGWI